MSFRTWTTTNILYHIVKYPVCTNAARIELKDRWWSAFPRSTRAITVTWRSKNRISCVASVGTAVFSTTFSTIGDLALALKMYPSPVSSTFEWRSSSSQHYIQICLTFFSTWSYNKWKVHSSTKPSADMAPRALNPTSYRWQNHDIFVFGIPNYICFVPLKWRDLYLPVIKFLIFKILEA